MQINNHQIVDYDAVLDAKLVQKVLPNVQRQKKRHTPFTQGRLSETRGKRLKSLRLN